MLISMRIRNLALVDDMTLELAGGFNAITGETGAGKSIIIGALDLVLGERADRELIRTGADSCSVEAVFSIGSVRRIGGLLEESGLEPCEGHQLLLKRVFSESANRQFINGSPCTLAQLKQIGDLLVDMHGPHDHQSLLRAETQIGLVDSYCKLEENRAQFQKLLGELKLVDAQKQALVMDEREFQQQLDLLRFQVGEIESAALQSGEEASVEQEYQVAFHAQKILELANYASQRISEGEEAILPALAQAQKRLQDLAGIDPKAAALEQTNRSIVIQLQDLASSLQAYIDRVDVDPQRLQELSDRLSAIQSLKRKYGRTLEEVIGFGQKAAEKLRLLQSRDAELAKLEQKRAQVEKELMEAGLQMRKVRSAQLPKLSKKIAAQLNDLGFPQAGFSAELGDHEPWRFGLDAARFLFAPNPGEPAKELKGIASSGEMSRVMLAIKTALADEDEIPVLVFDEIDANVGGQVAHKVGEKMAWIGKKRQVVCITHLPQVAAAADRHYYVSKEVRDGRTYSRISPIEGKGRVEEIARMLGGRGEAAVKHAKELLKGGSS